MKAKIMLLCLVLALSFSVFIDTASALQDSRDYVSSCSGGGATTIGVCTSTYDKATTDFRGETAGNSNFNFYVIHNLNMTIYGRHMTLHIQSDDDANTATSGDVEDCNFRLMLGTTTVYNQSFNQVDNYVVVGAANISYGTDVGSYTFNKINVTCIPSYRSADVKSVVEIEEVIVLGDFYLSSDNHLPTANLVFDNPLYILIPSFPISHPVNITPDDPEGDTIYYATDQDYGFVESGFGYEQTYGTDCDNTNWALGTGNDGRWIIWKKFLGQYLDAYIPGTELCAPESFSANGCWEPHYTLNSSSAPKVISKNGDCALSFGQYSEEIVFQYLRSTERTRDIEVKVGMDFSAYSKLNITLYNQHNAVFNFSVYANGTQLDVRHGQTTYWNQSRYSTDSGGNLRNSFIQLRITTYPNGTVKVLRGTIPPSSEYLMFSGTTSDPWTEIGFAGEFLESIDDFRLTYPSYQGITFTTVKPTTCDLTKMGWNYCKYYISDSYHQPYSWREYVASIEVLPSDLMPQFPNSESNATQTEKETAASGWREFWQSIKLADGKSFDQKIESYFFWMFGIMFIIGLFSTKNFMFTWTGASAICLVIALIQGWPIPAATMVVSLSAALALNVRP